MKIHPKGLSYDSVGIIPKKLSTQRHRDGDTSVRFCGIILNYPLIASPMPDVCNSVMATKLAELGMLGIIHRFQTIEEQVREYRQIVSENDSASITMNPIRRVKEKLLNKHSACAIAAAGDYQERFVTLHTAGCRIFCLDTANGFNVVVKEAIEWIRQFQYNMSLEDGASSPGDFIAAQAHRRENPVYIIAGNVATAEGYRFLAECGVDAIRVGIAGGSQCTTKNKTGVYVPMITSIMDCSNERHRMADEFADNGKDWRYGETYLELYNKRFKELPSIIGDGGIKEPSDANKGLIAGADIMMAGSILVPYDESPAEIVKFNDVLYKKYRGAASFGVQKEYTGQNPKFSEGAETLIRYERNVSVSKVIEDFKSGLQSSMSYVDAKNLTEYRSNAEFILL